MRRSLLLVLLGVMLSAGCGGSDESPLAVYVDEIEEVVDEAIEDFGELVATPEGGVLLVGQGNLFGLAGDDVELTDYTPADLHVALARLAEIQREAMAATASVEPPPEIARLHDLYFQTALPIADLASRAGTAADWQELSDSPEMAAYREALVADGQMCAEFQTELDALTRGGVFSDVPWMPTRLSDIADFTLGCDGLPANPEDVFRP